MGISDGFLDRNRVFYTSSVGNEVSNYFTLPKPAQDTIAKQIEDIMDQRFTFIRYNGLSSANIGKYVPADGSNPYSGSVVIIDEVHNFISRTSNQSDIARKLYDLLYNATDCKVVALSGTPVINRANEVAYLMNLLRGPLERIVVPVKSIPSVGRGAHDHGSAVRIPTSIRSSTMRSRSMILVTRNPPHFRSIYSEKGDRTAVQYVKDMPWIPLAADWVKSWASQVPDRRGWRRAGLGACDHRDLRVPPHGIRGVCDPVPGWSDHQELHDVPAPHSGLVSYFKGADERMLPRRVEDDKTLEKVPDVRGAVQPLPQDSVRRDQAGCSQEAEPYEGR
jgi:hypothetical protein